MGNSSTDDQLYACELADQITREVHFARDAGGSLYVFVSGNYQHGGESYIKRRVKQIAVAEGMAEKWGSKLAKETVEFIRADAPELWSTPPCDVINVENGLLNVLTRELN